MYHDQGLIPLKALHFDEGVNVPSGCRSCALRPTTAPPSTSPQGPRRSRRDDRRDPDGGRVRPAALTGVRDLPPCATSSRATASALQRRSARISCSTNNCSPIARIPGPLQGERVYEVARPGGLTRARFGPGPKWSRWSVTQVRRTARRASGASFPGKLRVIDADAMTIGEPPKLGPPMASPTFLIMSARRCWCAVLAASWPPWWNSLTLMFQQEVAERIVAKSCTGAFGGWPCSPSGARCRNWR